MSFNGIEKGMINHMMNFKGCDYATALEEIEKIGVEEANGNINTPFHQYVAKIQAQNAKKNQARRDRHAALTSLGLKRVRGAQGGIYYE